MMEIDQIAEICHEANRIYCLHQGDTSHRPWNQTPFAIKQSAIAGVLYVQENPDAPLNFLHENWRKHKAAEGWAYGEIKDESIKTHPCMLDYKDLPEMQRLKDTLFRSIARALINGEKDV